MGDGSNIGLAQAPWKAPPRENFAHVKKALSFTRRLLHVAINFKIFKASLITATAVWFVAAAELQIFNHKTKVTLGCLRL